MLSFENPHVRRTITKTMIVAIGAGGVGAALAGCQGGPSPSSPNYVSYYCDDNNVYNKWGQTNTEATSQDSITNVVKDLYPKGTKVECITAHAYTAAQTAVSWYLPSQKEMCWSYSDEEATMPDELDGFAPACNADTLPTPQPSAKAS
jgi:hypothetical protein